MHSNNRYCLCAAAQYVLLFLVLGLDNEFYVLLF